MGGGTGRASGGQAADLGPKHPQKSGSQYPHTQNQWIKGTLKTSSRSSSLRLEVISTSCFIGMIYDLTTYIAELSMVCKTQVSAPEQKALDLLVVYHLPLII